MNSIRVSILVLNVIFLFSAQAQTVKERLIKTEALTINDGLSQGMVNCMFQDRYGFMWFGTNDGLNRYDGYSFKVFRYDANDPNSISGNLITAVFEDSKGRLWVGTGLNGLNLFLNESESFIRFTHKPGENSITNNRILSIQEDKYGNIWIGTSSGLNRLTISNIDFTNGEKAATPIAMFRKKYKTSFKHINFDSSNKNNELFLFHDETTGLSYFEPTFYIDKRNILWAFTTNGLYHILLEENNSIQLVRPDNNKYRLTTINTPYQSDFIYNFLEDTLNRKLYLMRKGYFTILDQEYGNVNFHENQKLWLSTYRTNYILAAGSISGVADHAFIEYNLSSKTTYSFRPEIADHIKMMENANTVYRDHSGLVWIGTKGYGILKYNPKTEIFHYMSLPSIQWMYSTIDNNILVLSSNNFLIFKAAGTAKQFIIDTISSNKINNLIPFRKQDVIVKDRKENYFVRSSKVYQANGVLLTSKVLNDISTGCFPLFIDFNDDLWFGTNNSFCRYDTESGLIKQYKYPLSRINLTPYKFLECIFQENNDEFWLGTVEGLFHFNKKTEKWKHYYNVPGNKNSLSSNLIFSVLNDPKYPGKFLWVGTNGGGLNCLNKVNGTFTQYQEADGLPNPVIYGILNDNSGKLWLSTNRGISCFKHEYKESAQSGNIEIGKVKFRNFDESDGLQSNEFNRYAFAKSVTGALFFGGVNGINYFNPEDLSTSDYTPDVLITNFRLNNKPVEYAAGNVRNEENKVLNKPVYLMNKIVLPYSANMISFEFAAMDYTSSRKNRFRYKLENFDKEWIEDYDNHLATYTNLNPGEYVFFVTAGNQDGNWSDKGASIKVIILPPWYLTWWFQIGLLLLVVGTIYYVYQYRLKQALQVLQIRNSIATDLHDEIGSTLSSIFIYSEVAQRKAENVSPETSSLMKNISSEVANMIEALGDIVWTVNSKNDRFENIVNRMRGTAIELFEARGYKLHLDVNDKMNTLTMGMEPRRNFFLLFKEAINNIAKYANGKNVWISLKYINNSIYLSIKDDGVGFDITLKSNGNGLLNMHKRAEALNGNLEVNTAPGTGTEIILKFPNS
jgi:ligand-binding sensor domain-containing protein/two-component sensor histidine kinase